jgi:hypothetical protein
MSEKPQSDQLSGKIGTVVRTTASASVATAIVAALARTPMVLAICVALVAASLLVLVLAHVIANGKHAWRGTDPGPAGRALLVEPLRILVTSARRVR